MVIATSIGPGRVEQQTRAVESWRGWGAEVVSVNTPREIRLFEGVYPQVRFVRARQHVATRCRRLPFVEIAGLLEALRVSGHPSLGIVNSDIVLHSDPRRVSAIVEAAKDSVVFGNRLDVSAPQDVDGTRYVHGFDYFFFPPIDPRALRFSGRFHLGLPWWDYWFPLAAIAEVGSLKRLSTPAGFHVVHATRYSVRMYDRISGVFRVFLHGCEHLQSRFPEISSLRTLRRIGGKELVTRSLQLIHDLSATLEI